MTEVQEILNRTRSVYASCSSYSDEGEIVSVCIQGARQFEHRTVIKPFVTRFVRPDQFWFEYWDKGLGPQQEWPRYVVWTEGEQYRTWWTLEPDESPTFESIEEAISGPTGISGGSAHAVPSLLIAVDSLDRIIRGDCQLQGRESLDAAECWVLGSVAESETRRVWIDVDTGALRKAEHFHVIDPRSLAQDVERRIATLPPEEQAKLKELGVVEKIDQSARPTQWESTTVWRPQFDEDIPTQAFAFDPASLT